MRIWASKFPLISYDPEVKAPAVEHKKRRPRNDDSGTVYNVFSLISQLHVYLIQYEYVDESEGSTEPDLPLDYLAPARKKKRRKSTPAPSRVAYKSRMHDPGSLL